MDVAGVGEEDERADGVAHGGEIEVTDDADYEAGLIFGYLFTECFFRCPADLADGGLVEDKPVEGPGAVFAGILAGLRV